MRIRPLAKSTANQRKKHNAEKYIQWVYNAVADDTDLAVVASQICEIQPIFSKFELIQFKVIQGHRSQCQSKAHVQLPISH